MEFSFSLAALPDLCRHRDNRIFLFSNIIWKINSVVQLFYQKVSTDIESKRSCDWLQTAFKSNSFHGTEQKYILALERNRGNIFLWHLKNDLPDYTASHQMILMFLTFVYYRAGVHYIWVRNLQNYRTPLSIISYATVPSR